MNKILKLAAFFAASLGVLFFVACKKDNIATNSAQNATLESKVVQPNLTGTVDSKLSEIPYSDISVDNGMLHFKDRATVKLTMDKLYEADKIYVSNHLKDHKNDGATFDESYVFKQFEAKFNGFVSFRTLVDVDNEEQWLKYSHVIRHKPKRAILNQYQELMVGGEILKEYTNSFTIKIPKFSVHLLPATRTDDVVFVANLQGIEILQHDPRSNSPECGCQTWLENRRQTSNSNNRQRVYHEVGIYNDVFGTHKVWADITAWSRSSTWLPFTRTRLNMYIKLAGGVSFFDQQGNCNRTEILSPSLEIGFTNALGVIEIEPFFNERVAVTNCTDSNGSVPPELFGVFQFYFSNGVFNNVSFTIWQ